MKAAVVRSVADLRAEVGGAGLDALMNELADGVARTTGVYATQEELQAWAQTLPAFLAAVPDELDGAYALLELSMPIGAERADLVLIADQPARRALVVELKHWQGEVDAAATTPEIVVVVHGQVRTHPAYQVRSYVGKLENFHSAAQHYDLAGACFVAGGRPTTRFRDTLAAYKDVRVFFGNEVQDLGEFIRSFLGGGRASRDAAEQFASGTYTISAKLMEYVRQHHNDIKNLAYEKLAATGFGLYEDQMRVYQAILDAAERAKKEGPQAQPVVFVVDGPTGSGKTLVALTLLIDAIGRGLSAVYVLQRNMALRTAIQTALGRKMAGLVHHLHAPIFRTGLVDPKFDKHVDLAICDEAQRVKIDVARRALDKASVTVFFTDPQQRLNVEEEGTVEALARMAEEKGARHFCLGPLPSGVRCRGGRPYVEFVELLLTNPKALRPGFLANPPWGSDYEFRVCCTIDELLSGLRQRHERTGQRVALVASWTESTGDPDWRLANRPNVSDRNIRVGPRLQSGADIYPPSTPVISWVMHKDDYAAFWQGASCALDVCASIYGAQGHESEAVGFIWGRDLVWDPNTQDWSIFPGACFDTSTHGNRKTSLKELIDRAVADPGGEDWRVARELLVNRARIFLTRGILATYVYAEDPATRNFLLQLTGTDDACPGE